MNIRGKEFDLHRIADHIDLIKYKISEYRLFKIKRQEKLLEIKIKKAQQKLKYIQKQAKTEWKRYGEYRNTK